MRTLRSTLLALAVAILAGTLGTGTAFADTVVIDAVDSPAPRSRHRTSRSTRATPSGSSSTQLQRPTRSRPPVPTGRSTKRRIRTARRSRARSTPPGPIRSCAGPHRHERVDHGRRRAGQHARQGARVLEDRGLPPRLDPAGHRGDPGARHRQRLHRRRDRGRGRSSPTPTSRSTTSSSSSPRPATSSTTRSRPRSSTTSRPAAATRASTPPPTPSTRGPGTARCSAATSATTRPERRPRRSRSRTPTSPRRPASRPPGARVDEWYNFQPPTNPVVNGGGNDYSPRDSGVHVLPTVDESTYGEDDGNTADDDHPVAWCTNFDGGRAWYTAMGHTQASFAEPDFRNHLLGGLRTAARTVTADCGAMRQAPPAAPTTSRSARSTTTPRARWSSPSPRTAASSTSSASPARSRSSRPTATS